MTIHPSGGAMQPCGTPEHGKEQKVEKKRFNQLLNRIDDCGKAEQLNQIILEVTREYGYQYYQFCLLIPMGLLQCQIYLLSHSPDGWIKNYWENKYMQEDPLVHLAMRQSRPFQWRDLELTNKQLPAQSVAIMAARRERGMCDGVTFPLHGPNGSHGILSLSGGQDSELELADLPLLGILSSTIFCKANQLLNQKASNLSERERECLFWVSEGKTSWEVAKILGITERTVNFHLNSAIRKTGCRNRYQTIAHSISAGHLMPAMDRLTLATFMEI